MKINYYYLGIALTIAIFILAYMIVVIIKQNSQCNANPFVYGADKLAEAGTPGIGSFTPSDPRYSKIYFDEEGLYKENPIYSLALN